MTSHPLLDNIPQHLRKLLEDTPTSVLSAVSSLDSIRKIASLSLEEGPQRDALVVVLEAHAGASQIEIIETIIKGLKLRDPHSHFIISAIGLRVAERTTASLRQLENLLTLFPT